MALERSILIYGNDATLLDTRRWVLEMAHFRVTTTSALTTVLAALTQESPDLLVLCHTLTVEERDAVNAAAAASRLPIKMLVFSSMSRKTAQANSLGEVIDSFSGPSGLIAAAKRLLV